MCVLDFNVTLFCLNLLWLQNISDINIQEIGFEACHLHGEANSHKKIQMV